MNSRTPTILCPSQMQQIQNHVCSEATDWYTPVCACATFADVCGNPVEAERTKALLAMAGKCECAQHGAVSAAALESFCATHTFTASGPTAEAEGGATSRAAPSRDQHLSARQQEAVKRIIRLSEPGLLVFGRMSREVWALST